MQSRHINNTWFSQYSTENTLEQHINSWLWCIILYRFLIHHIMNEKENDVQHKVFQKWQNISFEHQILRKYGCGQMDVTICCYLIVIVDCYLLQPWIQSHVRKQELCGAYRNTWSCLLNITSLEQFLGLLGLNSKHRPAVWVATLHSFWSKLYQRHILEVATV